MTAAADPLDEHGDEAAVCILPLRSFGRRRAFSGEIRTARCHEDNVVLRRTLGEPGDGRVLVVDGGWAGIVINGCTRRFRCDRVVCDR